MAKVEYIEPVESLSGKLSKSSQVIYHLRKQSGRCYTSIRHKHRAALTEDEQARCQQFRIVKQAALAREHDLSHLTNDQQAWRTEQRRNNTNYSFQGWLFSKAWHYFDPATRQVHWPDSLCKV